MKANQIFLLLFFIIILGCQIQKIQNDQQNQSVNRQISSTETSTQRTVFGYLDNINNGLVSGWTCVKGYSRSIDFKIFVGGPLNQGFDAGTYTASGANEPAVNEACATTNSSHRFAVKLPDKILRQLPGQPVYVYGINPQTKNYEWINFNGKYVTPDINPKPNPALDFSKQQIIGDMGFTNGFKVMDIDGSELYVNRMPGEHLGTSTWEIAQWGTLETIPNIPNRDKNYYTWENQYKSLSVGISPANQTEVIFGIDSNAEYSGNYRRRDESRTWPHLLISQTIAIPENLQNYRPLAYAKKMMLSLDIQVLSAHNIKKSGYDKSIHASQFVLYFTLQNLNPNTKSYKKYIWFGVPLYDDRFPFPSAATFIDKATQSLIWAPDGREILSTSLHDLKMHSIYIDLLPNMKKAIDYAYRKGIMDTNNLNDFYIGHMNTGFEVPGLAQLQVKIKNLGLVQFN